MGNWVNQGLYNIIQFGYDKYIKELDNSILVLDKSYIKNYKKNKKIHNKLIKKFPHHIDVLCDYQCSNIIYQIGIKELGLPEEECVYCDIFNEYCDKNLVYTATLSIITDDDKYVKGLKENTFFFKKRIEMVMDHSHIGSWSLRYLDEVDFDKSYERLYFKNQDDMNVVISKLIMYPHHYELLL